MIKTKFIMNYFVKSAFATLTIVFALFGLSGCSKSKDPAFRKIDAEEVLYNDAMKHLERGRYESALTKIEDIELEYPNSANLHEALYLKAKALHSAGRYDESNDVIETFLVRFPHSEFAEELLFTKSLNYYERVIDIGRDQHMTFIAHESLQQFLKQYPRSSYSTQAKLKLEYLEAALAGKEMDIGYFYYKKKNYSASLRRFQNVIENYSTTIFTPEALYRTAEIFLILRMPKEAKVYAAVLGKNYPNSKWYHKIYQNFEKLDAIN